MKRSLRFVMLLGVSSIVMPALVLAHGGGLDAYGCHHNRKAGGYHCHRGPLAGQSFGSKEDMLAVLNKEKRGTDVKTSNSEKK